MSAWKFQAMLGPAEEYPVGSVEWAERIGHRLQIHVEKVKRTEGREVKYLPPVLEAIRGANPPPWDIWPPDNPCRWPEAWFQTVTGERVNSLAKLIEAYEPKSPLIPWLQGLEAQANPVEKWGRVMSGASPLKANEHSSTSTKRILARLARDRPDILAAFKSGEYKSARAAAIAAGFVKVQSDLDLLRKIWARATPKERRTFLEEVR